MMRTITFFLTLLICFTAATARNVSVRDFGAVGDGVTLDTEAVQAAIDSVASLGGAL